MSKLVLRPYTAEELSRMRRLEREWILRHQAKTAVPLPDDFVLVGSKRPEDRADAERREIERRGQARLFDE